MSNQEILDKIDNGEYTLYDKFLYGGLGYGHLCLNKNGLRVILSIIFPPIAIILKHLQLKENYPYITKEGLINLYNNLGDVMYSVLLTFLFWVPGVVYSFQQFKPFGGEYKDDNEKFENTYGFPADELNVKMVKEIINKRNKKTKFGIKSE